MSEATERTEVLGEAGNTCSECGAPLAIDQRYCLNCGRRRGAPRVDFREHLSAENGARGNGAAPSPQATAAPTPPAVTAVAEEKPGRDYAPLAAVGGIAILGLMLLVGVLIGKGDGGTATAPPPQVVRLGGESGGEAASEEGGGDEAGALKQAKGKGAGKSKNAGNSASGKGGAPVEASDEALQQLQEQSPEEYQESSAKLPDEIATGGAPPAEDNKAPGGGSKGTAIE